MTSGIATIRTDTPTLATTMKKPIGWENMTRKDEREMEELLTVEEVAEQLRIDPTTCRRWIKDGILEAVTLLHSGKRRSYRIKKSTLDALVEPKRQLHIVVR